VSDDSGGSSSNNVADIRYASIETLDFSEKLTHACSTKQLISMIATHCHKAKSANPSYMIKETEEGRGPSGIFQSRAVEEICS